MSALTNAPALLDGRTLLPDDLFTRLETRIRSEHPELPPGMPARVLDQALAFLAACAVATKPIGPSPLVDIGWHTFLLHTVDYAEFCERIAGRFIHHVPDDEETKPAPAALTPDCGAQCGCNTNPKVTSQTHPDEADTESPERGTLRMTVAAIRNAGYRVDQDLWPAAATADCTQCHAGCHDSPTR